MSNAPPSTRLAPFLAVVTSAQFLLLMLGTFSHAESSQTLQENQVCRVSCQGKPNFNECVNDCLTNVAGWGQTQPDHPGLRPPSPSETTVPSPSPSEPAVPSNPITQISLMKGDCR